MSADDTHWNINKDSRVINVDGQKGPKHWSVNEASCLRHDDGPEGPKRVGILMYKAPSFPVYMYVYI